MLEFTIKNNIRNLKVGQVISLTNDLEELKLVVMVGSNGSGKSTLLQALRAKFPRTKEVSLKAEDLKLLLKDIEIKSDYEAMVFLDLVFDDPSDMMNAYDACAYVDAKNFLVRNKSHGEKNLTLYLDTMSKLFAAPPTKKTLVVFDEVDAGFDLRFQAGFYNGLLKLVGMGYHVLCVSHNPILMMKSSVVFDLERALKKENPFCGAAQYIAEQAKVIISRAT